MIKTIELRKIIQGSLKAIHPRVYFGVAPETVQFPYLVFELPNSTDLGSLEVYNLDVDGWDNSSDTSVLESLMDIVDKGLQRQTFNVAGLYVTLYRANRLTLTDEDPKIKRRKYIYQVRIYEGGN